MIGAIATFYVGERSFKMAEIERKRVLSIKIRQFAINVEDVYRDIQEIIGSSDGMVSRDEIDFLHHSGSLSYFKESYALIEEISPYISNDFIKKMDDFRVSIKFLLEEVEIIKRKSEEMSEDKAKNLFESLREIYISCAPLARELRNHA